MKKIYLLFCLLSIGIHAQNVVFGDANMKAKIVSSNATTNQVAKDASGNWFAVDANGDGEIQQAEADAVMELDLVEKNPGGFVVDFYTSEAGTESFSNAVRVSYPLVDIVKTVRQNITQTNVLISEVSIPGVEQLVVVQNSPNVQVLNLKNEFTAFAQYMPMEFVVQNMTELVEIELEKTSIGSNGFIGITHLVAENLMQLKEITTTSFSNVTPSVSITGSTNLEVLENVDLSNVDFADAGFSHLRKIASGEIGNLTDLPALEELRFTRLTPTVDFLMFPLLEKLNVRVDSDIIINNASNLKELRVNTEEANLGLSLRNFNALEELIINDEGTEAVVVSQLTMENINLPKLKVLGNLSAFTNASKFTFVESFEFINTRIKNLELVLSEAPLDFPAPLDLEEFSGLFIGSSNKHAPQWHVNEQSFLTHFQLESFTIKDLVFEKLPALDILHLGSSLQSGGFSTGSGIPNLEHLVFSGEHFIGELSLNRVQNLQSTDTVLDLSNLNQLEKLYLSNNLLYSDIILDDLVSLTTLSIKNTPSPSQIYPRVFMKNGAGNLPTNIHYEINSSSSNPIAVYFCTDNSDVSSLRQLLVNQFSSQTQAPPYNLTVNSFCSPEPGGDFNTLQGEVRIDSDGNGCDQNDPFAENILFDVSGDQTSSFASSSGTYSMYLQGQNFNITPRFDDLHYSLAPASLDLDFSTDASPFTQDFCLTPVPHKDAQVTLRSLTPARPGFGYDLALKAENKGTETFDASITLAYPEDFVTFDGANPAPDSNVDGLLTWNSNSFGSLDKFESLINFTVNTPTDATFPVNDGDVLDFVGRVEPLANDVSPENNTFALNQTVVNSFDPNDKTCLEGDEITDDKIGEFVHYLIRFENLGSANAVNVVVTDTINVNQFDLASLVPMESSHDYNLTIRDNVLEFYFEDIQLPFDDANNDGYILFKIKTLSTLALGDSFSNDANIYFDFNFPITTNLAQTSIEPFLNTVQVGNAGDFDIYPQPAKNELFIRNAPSDIDLIEVYNVAGNLIVQSIPTQKEKNAKLNVAKFPSGVYFVRIKTLDGIVISKKFIKN